MSIKSTKPTELTETTEPTSATAGAGAGAVKTTLQQAKQEISDMMCGWFPIETLQAEYLMRIRNDTRDANMLDISDIIQCVMAFNKYKSGMSEKSMYKMCVLMSKNETLFKMLRRQACIILEDAHITYGNVIKQLREWYSSKSEGNLFDSASTKNFCDCVITEYIDDLEHFQYAVYLRLELLEICYRDDIISTIYPLDYSHYEEDDEEDDEEDEDDKADDTVQDVEDDKAENVEDGAGAEVRT
jgi:molybdopterin converting factor small subunit